MATGCLSFFTSNHPAHAKQWLQKGSQYTLVCVACLVEIIENKNEPSIKKTKTLQELLKLISTSALLQLLKENENVLSHLLKCLWDLMDYEEGKPTQNITVVEIVFQLCCALNSEQFVEKVVEKLTTKLISTENVKKVWLQLNLLGKLIQNIPSLTGNLVKSRTNLISFLGKWTSYPDEGTRSSLFFILTHFYRHPQYCAEIPWEITDLVFRECCEVLTTATTKELQINSIALLQSLTAKENSSTTSKAIACYMDLVITCLKKAFLSTIDLVLTIAIGCLSNLVEFDENMINTDLPGFLFEVFHSKNDSLLSLGLKSIDRFLDNELMYTKGHVVYGFDAMLSALLAATDSKNIKVLRQGFEVLRNIFEKCPQELVLISSQDVLKKCLDVITKGLTICDDHVILEATSCLGVVLTRRHYCGDVLYGQLGELVELVVRRLGKVCHSSGHWNRVENKDLKSSTIAAVLEVINKSLDLVIFGRSKPPSIEVLLASTNESILQELERFLKTLLKLCDQICIPNIISNLRNIDDTTVPETFFKVLNKLLQTCSPDGNYEMAKKFVSSCFIRIALETKAQHVSSTNVQDPVNAFLQTMCCCLLPGDMREIAGNVLSSSLQRVNGTAQELLQILKQKNAQDEILKITQECILIVFHLAYINGDRLIPRAQLLHALSTFLVLNPTCYCDSSTVIPRCLTQLYLKELYQTKLDSSHIYFDAQRILADGLQRNMESLSFLYFHDIALLQWSVTFQELDPNLRKEIMELWFSHGSETDNKEKEMTFWKRIVNENPGRLLMLVSTLSSVDVHAQNSLLEVIQHVLQFSNIQAVKQVLPQLKQAVQKLFLNQAVDPLSNQNMESILQLLCLLVTMCVTEPLDEGFNKLVYHVVNFLTHHANSSGLHVKCLNFLNACVIQDTKHASDKVLSFLLNHQEYNSFLETVIHSYQCSTQLERTQQTSALATVLVSICQLLHLQNTFGISAKNVISVKAEAVLLLLTYCSNPLLQIAANLFWQSVLKCLESRKLSDSNLVLIFEDTEHCEASSSAENLTTTQERTSERKLTKIHLQMILIYLQNSLFHVNILVKLTALRCLEALFSLEEHAGHLIQNPWNTSLLRECEDFSTPTSLGFTMRLFSLFLQHKRLKSLRIAVPVKELVKAVLEQSDYDESVKENAVSDLYLSALARFFSEVVQCGLMTDAEKSTLKNHVKRLVEIFQTNKDREHERRFVYLQEMLVHDEIIQGKMNILNSLHDLQVKLD